MEKKPSGCEKEKCVLCKKTTIYENTTHIEFRDYYVEGVGQLCQDCYFDLVLQERRRTR